MLTSFFNLLLNRNPNNTEMPKPSAEKPRACIEYVQGHWAVMIKNPGQNKWDWLLQTGKRINLYNDFGDLLGSKPAIQSFESHSAAEAWVQENVPSAIFEKRKTKMGDAYEASGFTVIAK